jgi:outer membrane immunogenic protein
MKKILGGLALGVLLAGPVAAADLPARMPVKAAPAPIVALYSWTGCYIGGHVGFAWAKKRLDFTPNPFGLDFDHDMDGFVAGGQVGCNIWQNDRVVFGIEGQASWADMDGSTGTFTQVTAFTANHFRTEADVIGSIAARLGYAAGANGQTLLFVKGGAAFIHEQFFATGPGGFTAQSDEKLRWGWMVGAGIEQVLTGAWTVKAEYNFSHFGTKDVDLCQPAGLCSSYEIKQHVHLVKVGLNYRFGGFGGPVVARY